ncbi:MAG: ABC transporter permease [Wenzhouxiangellaceae bacterium]
MDKLLKDTAYAAQQSLKRWGVSLVVILSIALGVSANAVVFGWINDFVLNPLPSVPETSRLLAFTSQTDSGDFIDSSYADFVDYRAGLADVGELMLYKHWPVSLESDGRKQRAAAVLVSSNYFSTLDLQPQAGRFFIASDQVEVSGGSPVVVISDSYWESRYDRAADAIGQNLILNRLPYTIIGVAPAGFSGTAIGGNTDFWLPLMQLDSLTAGSGYWITDRKTRPFAAMLRLNSGVDIEAAQTQINVIAKRLQAEYPRENQGMTAALFPFVESPDGGPSDLSLLLGVLFFASLLVLFIIASNLINLFMARIAEREKELAIRMALGSRHFSIMRLVIIEGLILSLVAAIVSIVAVHLMYGLLTFFSPDIYLPVSRGGGLAPVLVIYTLLLSFALGFAVSVLPALRAIRIDVNAALKETNRGSSSGRRSRLLQVGLIVSQVALAFVTLSAAASFVNSFNRITRIDPGFDTANVQLVALTPSGPIAERAMLIDYVDRLRQRMTELPSVRSVAFAEYVPLGFSGGSWEDIAVQGYTPRQGENMKMYRNFVSEDYFTTMGIELVEGRAFMQQDDSDSDLVAIVNQTFANRYFADRSPLGRIITGWGREIRIVGVAADSKYRNPIESPRPYLYLPFRQFARTGGDTIMHVAGDSEALNLASVAPTVVNQAGSLMYVSWTSTMASYTSASVFNQKLIAVLLGLLGLTALVLSALGIYGVVSHSVAQRTHEIGIRMALGASVAYVFRMILLQNLKYVVIGLIVGALLYLFMWEGIRDLLYGVDAIELLTMLLVALILVVLAIAASVVPTYRASTVDPVKALSVN